MKHMAILAAMIAAIIPTSHAFAATSLEYKVHAILPRGENISATVSMRGHRPDVSGASGRDVGAVMDVVNIATTIAKAAASGKHGAQVAIGPAHGCVDVTITQSGNTVTATGTMDLPPPPPRDENGPPRDQNGPPRNEPPPPGQNKKATILVVEVLDQQHQLVNARGKVQPENNARAPHFEWTLEKIGE